MANQKEERKEKLRKDLIKNFAYVAAVASNPNERFGTEHVPTGISYTQLAFDRVYKSACDEAKAYLAPQIEAMTTDWSQNGAYSPLSMNLIKGYAKAFGTLTTVSKLEDILDTSKNVGLAQVPDFLKSNKDKKYVELVKTANEEYEREAKKAKEEQDPKAKTKAEKKANKAQILVNGLALLTESILKKAKNNLFDDGFAYTMGEMQKKYEEKESKGYEDFVTQTIQEIAA